ncbi:MAG: DNA repair protein RadC [Gammaproteobacteria bacterium]|nr:DNA repair protein RadC [Gammaproteobacteria bacterium]
MSPCLKSMSDVDVLGVLVGRRNAAQLIRDAGGSLSELLKEAEVSNDVRPQAVVKLDAAKELIRRSLVESMRHRDALESIAAVRDYLRLTIGRRDYEVFMVLFLDTKHRVIAPEEMFRGTLSQASVYPREVVKRSMAHNAAAVIFAHNHPSGVAEPSAADEAITQALRNALALLDVRVLDHLVVAGNEIVSFAERGLL